MGVSAQTLAEIQRKAKAGIPLTNATADKQKLYDSYKTPQVTQNVQKTANTVNTAGVSANVAQKAPAYAIPAYGSNVAGFDPNNAQHKLLADSGQAWATAKASGDTAGMSAAAAKGAELRAGVPNATYDTKAGVTTFQTPQPTAVVNPAPATGDPYGQLTPTQINTEAGAQLARERAALQTAATKRLTDLKSGFDYSNKLLQDNRTLENAQMDRTLNPFSGRTSYDKGMVNRGRGIDDSNRAAQFNAETAAVQEDLYNFDKLAPERQQQVLNELTRLERAYGIDVGQLTGNFNGQRTLAGQQFDWQRNTDTADRTGYLGGQRTLQGVQLDRSMFESDREFEFRKGQQEWQNMFTQKQFDESKASRLWEQTFKQSSFAQDVKEAAASRGLQWANLGQRDKEFIADQAFREKQFKLEKDKFGASQGGEKPANYKYKDDPDYKEDYLDAINDPAGFSEHLTKNAQTIIQKYGIDGYNALKALIPKK